jgi:hypothetical protein
MKSEDVLKHIPQEGFLKLTQEKIEISEAKRMALIRKGNEFFNRGAIDLAKKVFLTAQYADGLVRLGDRYLSEKKPLEAFRMYWIARNKNKKDRLVEKMSSIIRQWLQEER